jgi:hypothetical protein
MPRDAREQRGDDERWARTVLAGIEKANGRLRELGVRGFGEVRIVAAKTGNKWEITWTLSERVEV